MAPSASSASLVPRETALSPRLLVLTLGGDRLTTSWGTNRVALAAAAVTLVVDPMIAPAHARLVEEALCRRGFPEVRHVVLTHHHTDHALGAALFAGRGAIVVAHVRCAAAMAAQHPAILAARRRTPELAALFADAAPYTVRPENVEATVITKVTRNPRPVQEGRSPTPRRDRLRLSHERGPPRSPRLAPRRLPIAGRSTA